jgi:hypothetical protein
MKMKKITNLLLILTGCAILALVMATAVVGDSGGPRAKSSSAIAVGCPDGGNPHLTGDVDDGGGGGTVPCKESPCSLREGGDGGTRPV